MEKLSNFDRIVGVTPEQEEATLESLSRMFNTPVAAQENGRNVEVTKSPELEKCIEEISRMLQEYLHENYGAPTVETRPDQVHLINTDTLSDDVKTQMTDHDKALGSFDSMRQGILVFKDEKSIGRVALAHVIAHEMIHLNSFQSLQKSKEVHDDRPLLENRRMGIMVRSGEFYHFRDLNEAITEELASRFSNMAASKLEFTKEEFENRYYGQLHSSAYWKEREDLNRMIEDILEANRDTYEDEEEVFKLFVDGALRGRLLPLVRAYEKTYGKGSFSDLADDMEELII